MKPMCLPFVAGIIERVHDGQRQLLIQTRFKPRSSIYNGTFEFTAGVLDHPYESVHDALAREIKEETGMTLERIIDDSRTETFAPQGDGAFGFRPFCCVQQLKGEAPWIGFIFRCEVKDGQQPVAQEGETQDVHWADAKEFKTLLDTTPEKVFTLEIPAWHYYFQEVEI